MNGKASTILNTSWQTMRFKLSSKGKKTNILKEKPKVAYSVALVLVFLSVDDENNDNRKICHWPILAVYLKDFFCR